MFVTYDAIVNEELRRFGLSIDAIVSCSPDKQQDASFPAKSIAGDALTDMLFHPIAIIPRANVDCSGETVISFHTLYCCVSQTRDKVGKYRLDPTNSYFPAKHCDFAVSKLTVKEEELSESTWELLQAFLRKRQGLKPSIVYRLADIPAATFHRISKRNFHPKKETLLKIGVVLQLTLEEMTDFLASAGFAFNPSDKRDVLIKKCFQERVLNLQDITQRLEGEGLDIMDFNLALLGKMISDQLAPW